MATKKTTTTAPAALARYNALLIRPRFTEKAVMQNALRVYTFEVAKDATKNEIKKAIEALFKVSPIKVTTQTIKPRAVVVRGRAGKAKGMKKAMVYLKEGDVINFA